MVFTCSCICVQSKKEVIQGITSFIRNHAHINIDRYIYICKNISNTSGVRAQKKKSDVTAVKINKYMNV